MTERTSAAAARRSAARTRPKLQISYDADVDFLWALRFGEVIDGHLEDETEEPLEGFYVWRRGRCGPVIGFGVENLYEFPTEELEDALRDRDLRFDVPMLGLQDAGPEEIILAARATLDGLSTPDIVLFDLAVEAGSEGELEEAEAYWRQCLASGAMKAHFGLGYTLFDLRRHREAYGHLRTYAEIVPRNSWAWVWLGKACEEVGERQEATTSYYRAMACERMGSFETDAEELLEALHVRRRSDDPTSRKSD